MANQRVCSSYKRGQHYKAPADAGQAGMRAHFCQLTDFSTETVNHSSCLQASEFQMGQYGLAKQNLPTCSCSASFIFYLLQAPLPFLLTICPAQYETHSYDQNIIFPQLQVGTSLTQVSKSDVHQLTCLYCLIMVHDIFASNKHTNEWVRQMKNTQEAVLPNFKSIYPNKVALLDFKPNSREAIVYSMEVYHPPHLSDNKWKILVSQGYIKKRQTS